MKKVLLTLTLLFIATLAFSQDREEAAYQAAIDICNCTESMIGDAHPQMLEYIYNVGEYGEEEAMQIFQEYLATASEQDQQKIMEDAQRFQNVMTSPEYQDCMGMIETKYEKFQSDATFLEIVKENLSSLEDCKLTLILMQIGENN